MNRRATDRQPEHIPAWLFVLPLAVTMLALSGCMAGMLLRLHGCAP